MNVILNWRQVSRLHLRLMLRVGRRSDGLPVCVTLKQEIERLCTREPRRWFEVRRGWRYF